MVTKFLTKHSTERLDNDDNLSYEELGVIQM